MSDYFEKYKEQCEKLNEATNKDEARQHNDAMKKLRKLYYEIERLEDKTFLLKLLNDENPRTSTLVASHCLGLGLYVKEAKNVLSKNSKIKNNPTVAFNAGTILEIYKSQGSLEI